MTTGPPSETCRCGRCVVALAWLVLLAACGTTQPAMESIQPATAVAVVPESYPPVATVPAPIRPTEIPPTVVPSSFAPAVEAPPTVAPATAAPTATASTYQGVPQGRTAEGAPTLGAVDAPLVLTDYSDFL